MLAALSAIQKTKQNLKFVRALGDNQTQERYNLKEHAARAWRRHGFPLIGPCTDFRKDQSQPNY
jgi:hypothetical protein